MTALAAILASGSLLPLTPPPDVDAEVAYNCLEWHGGHDEQA